MRMKDLEVLRMLQVSLHLVNRTRHWLPQTLVRARARARVCVFYLVFLCVDVFDLCLRSLSTVRVRWADIRSLF